MSENYHVFPLKRVAMHKINEAIEEAKEKLASQEDAELTVLEAMLTNPEMRPKEVLVMILDMLLAGIDTVSPDILEACEGRQNKIPSFLCPYFRLHTALLSPFITWQRIQMCRKKLEQKCKGSYQTRML